MDTSVDLLSVESITFFLSALVVLGGAFGVITARNPVHAALGLVATLFGIAVLFLAQDAELLAAVQVIVYTGAIVVLILFVLMLLGVETLDDVDDEPLVGQTAAAVFVGLGLLGILVTTVFVGGVDILTGTEAATSAIDPNESNIAQVGRVLFTDYIFAFEITALLLTIAVVGAVVLARRSSSYAPLPEDASLDAPEPFESHDDVEGSTH